MELSVLLDGYWKLGGQIAVLRGRFFNQNLVSSIFNIQKAFGVARCMVSEVPMWVSIGQGILDTQPWPAVKLRLTCVLSFVTSEIAADLPGQECAISSFSVYILIIILYAKTIFTWKSHNGRAGTFSSHHSVDQSSYPAGFAHLI